MFGGRAQSFFGGPEIRTVASAATLTIPDDASTILVSGSTTVTLLDATLLPGRTLRIIGATSASVAFTNTDDTTTEGQMDLGGSNRTVGARDVLVLVQGNDGSWTMQTFTDN